MCLFSNPGCQAVGCLKITTSKAKGSLSAETSKLRSKSVSEPYTEWKTFCQINQSVKINNTWHFEVTSEVICFSLDGELRISRRRAKKIYQYYTKIVRSNKEFSRKVSPIHVESAFITMSPQKAFSLEIHDGKLKLSPQYPARPVLSK